jgi:hydrogenase maturation protease
MYAIPNTIKLLVFGYGNPGRGDDILGHKLVDDIEALGLHQVYCQSTIQLQIEHVTDLTEYDQVLFVDADFACSAPYHLSPVLPKKDNSYTTHTMTPAALLYLYSQNYHTAPPSVSLLRIRGYKFELGAPLSAKAETNLKAATEQAIHICRSRNLENELQKVLTHMQ